MIGRLVSAEQTTPYKVESEIRCFIVELTHNDDGRIDDVSRLIVLN